MKNVITELSKMDGRVYVYVETAELRERFLQDAEAEGFTFCDGCKPTERELVDDIYAVNSDGTINFVGVNGHVAYKYFDHIGEEELIKINYAFIKDHCKDSLGIELPKTRVQGSCS